jgi:hypothetical protein
VETELLSIFAAHLAAPTAPSKDSTPSKKKTNKKAAAAAAAAAEELSTAVDGGEAAKQYLEGLAALGRYQRDVWYT